MSDQPPPPWGDQPSAPGPQPTPPTQQWPPGGQPPQGPGGYGGQPPPGFGSQPPGGYGGQPPQGFGGQPPQGFGGQPPPGFGGQPPPKSKAPLIVGIIAAVLIVGGGIGAVLLLSGGDDDVVVSDPTPTVTQTAAATEAPSATATPTPVPRPTSTMPAAPPEPPPATLPGVPTTAPAPPPAGGGTSMTMNEGVTGTITAAEPVQSYFFDGVADQDVVLTMIAVDDSLDPTLALYGPDGTLLEENDDDSDLGSSTDSRIQFRLPVDGEYRVDASSFASTTGAFELTLSFPSVLSAEDTLSDAVPEIAYDYEGTAGQTIVINMRGLDDQIDPLVYVEDAQGNEIGRDDDGGPTPLDARLQITIPADGTYTIVASSFAERFGAYELSVTEL